MREERASQRGVRDTEDLGGLESRIGHHFKSRQLLLDALTHRSYAYENAAPSVVHNERLEFLGDAVLQLLSSDLLYRRSPKASEGDLSNLRAALVRASTLAGFARRISLGPSLRLGRGEETTGGRDRELLIASAFEAVLGAVYLDGGLRAAQAFVEPLLRDEIERVTASKQIKDDKSLLQELAQAQLGVTPTYVVVSQDGPSHDRSFVVEVHLGDYVAARGAGHSKRQAEQDAARSALADEGWQTDRGRSTR
ncbi:MAG TPA: ribonuclease III [Ktedonobacterales bacterium]|nr:ribonuclease III [Ktedonobacterales bacterium]